MLKKSTMCTLFHYWKKLGEASRTGVVDRPKHRGVEAPQSLVDVPKLDNDAAAQDSQEHLIQAESSLI